MTTMAGDWCGGFGAADLHRLQSWLRDQAMQMSGERAKSHGRHAGRGYGPPWARGWEGWWGGPPGRPRASKGNVRLAILALLRESPRHGYQLIQDIAERSHGAWTPSAGSVYPSLSVLQDEGLIDDEKTDGRRIFRLTEEGAQYVQDNASDIDAVFGAFDGDERASYDDLHSLMIGVGAAAVQVIASGRSQDAQRILNRARRDLFAVLAEDEDEES